jgi:hypothetical protein
LIYGDEAKTILEESITNLNRWWEFFEENIKNLDNIPYMIDEVLPKLIPKSEIDKFPQKLKEAVTYWLCEGFKISKGI